MKIENIKVEDIKLYEKNARKHPKKQIDLLIKNIKRFGFTTPLLIDKNNELIAGHGRIMAGNQIGMTEYPCVRLENLTPDEVKALRLADNQIASLAEWDLDLALPELKGLDIELQGLTGFDKEILIEPEERDDEVPETPEIPKTVLGDIYELGNHRVMCGDSTMIDQVEKLMNGEKANMVFTDPPYELETKGGGVLKDSKSMRGIESLGIGHFEPSIELHKANTSIFCCNKPLVKKYLDIAEENKLPFDICVYKKENTAPNYGGHMMTDTEYLIIIGQQSPNKGLNKQMYSKVFIGNKDSDNETSWSKPIALCEKFILLYSKDSVLDIFLGSGSTLIACEKTNRKCYGMEIDPHYVDVCVERWCQYTGIRDIVKNGQNIRWETES